MAIKTLSKPAAWKRFTNADIESYTGKQAQPIVDMRSSVPQVRICDGVTPGGHPVGSSPGVLEGVAIPQIIAPLIGATGVALSPIITLSQFNGILSDGSADIHTATTLTFWSDVNKTNQIYTTGRLTSGNLTTIDLSGLHAFDAGSKVYFEATYEGSTGNTAASPLGLFEITVTEGTILSDGGIVAGKLGSDWIIVAPATMRARKQWGLYDRQTSLPDISSMTPDPETGENIYVDPNTGKHNTDVLTGQYASVIDVNGVIGSPAAQYCRDHGYDLPNSQETLFIYKNRAAIDAADTSSSGVTLASIVANAGGTNRVLASTEYNGYSAIYTVFSATGTPVNSATGKSNDIWVIPVRRIPA